MYTSIQVSEYKYSPQAPPFSSATSLSYKWIYFGIYTVWFTQYV